MYVASNSPKFMILIFQELEGFLQGTLSLYMLNCFAYGSSGALCIVLPQLCFQRRCGAVEIVSINDVIFKPCIPYTFIKH